MSSIPLQDTTGNQLYLPSTCNITDISLISIYWSDILGKPSFCNVAITANYNDLINLPSNNGSSSVIFSGDYNGLSNQPWINNNSNIYFIRNGNVGIGSMIPAYKLDVIGDINFTGNLRQNGVLFQSGTPSQWTTNETSIYYNGGNVGIGDTNPVSKLTIKSTYDVVNSGLCINANDSSVAEKYMLKLYPYVVATNKVGYKFRIINQPTSFSYDALWFRNDGYLNIPASLAIGTIRQPLTTLDVQGTIACINSATWDHLRLYHDGVAAYFDAGGAENGIVFRINNTASGFPAPSYPERMRISAAGNVGINNDAPLVKGTDTILSIGKVTQTCCGRVVIAQNTGSGSQRKGSLHYDANYNLCLGDFGGNNSGADTITSQFLLYYGSPADTIETFANGNVNIYGNLYQGSDNSYKTDINTIQEALWKVQQLRGVEYTHTIEGDRKLGLIAQEVEYILPEAVAENGKGNKCVSYTEIVPVLINAIKELTERLEIAEAILKKNNLF